MKRYILKTTVLMLSLSFMIISCSTDDDETPNDNSAQIEELISISSDGTWVIQTYMDSGVDETSDYSDYTFIFVSNGNLTASSPIATRTGAWSVTDDSNSSDDNLSDIDFNIMFETTSEDDIFEDLNDDWDVIAYSNTEIQLRDVSGDDSVDTLVFVKN